MVSRMDFDMFFVILIFDPKCGFCMGLGPLLALFQSLLFFEYQVFYAENSCDDFLVSFFAFFRYI